MAIEKDAMFKMAEKLWAMKAKNFNMSVASSAGNIKTGGVDRDSSSKGIDKVAFNYDYADTQFYSPRLQPESWFLPRTRKMVLKWVKIFFDWDPAIHSILKMHSRYPISEFNLSHSNQKQVEYISAVLHREDWDIMDTLREASLSFVKYGEAAIMGSWDSKFGIWKSMVCLDPALIELEEIPFTGQVKVYAEIPRKYIRIIKSGKPSDQERVNRFPEALVNAVKEGKKYIELDTSENCENGVYSPPKVCFISNKTDVGEAGIRGLPPLVPLFRTLVYQDFLKKAQYSRAQRFAYPIEFWTLGDLSQGILPDEAALSEVQQMLKTALASPPYSIIYSPLLKLDVVGATGSLLPIYDDLAFCENQILIGLGVNKNIVLGEGGWMSNAKTLSLQRLIMDYSVDRDMWTRKFLKNFVLRPICIAKGWTKNNIITGEKIADIPEINWVRSLDMQQEEDIRRMYFDLWKEKVVSTKTLLAMYPNLNYEAEIRNLESEKGTILDNMKRGLPEGFTPLDSKNESPSNVSVETPTSPSITPEKPSIPERPESPEK